MGEPIHAADSHTTDSLTASFTDGDLQLALRRALRLVLYGALVLTPVIWAGLGWRSLMLFYAGTVLSATGIWEWRRLLATVSARLENQRPASPMALVLVLFVLRLGLAAGLMYVTLKCFEGSLYALVAGISLALIAIAVEAVRLVRR